MASNEVEVLDPAATVGKLKNIAAGRALDRRRFLAALGLTGAAAGAALVSGCSSSTTQVVPPTIGQTDVLNFALNLEYLEATFYSYITQGADLPSTLTIGGGTITGTPGKLTFAGANAAQITDMLNEIYYDELSHVTDLRGLLGSIAVPRPAINLAALGSVTASDALSIARVFEDVGVTAYAGATAALTTGNLAFASQILGTESFHSGALRFAIILQNAAAAGTDAYIKADSLDVAPADEGSATAAAAGPTSTGGFFATSGASTASASVPAGLAFTRTTSQVLSIVYASTASGTKSGGFFPSGVNGLINTV